MRRQIQARRVASVKDIWRVLDKHVLPSKHGSNRIGDADGC